MNKHMFLTISLLLGNFGCASEKLYVKVVDDEGCPVANAVVKVGVPPKTAFWGSPSRISKGKAFHELTDENGEAIVSFDCTGANFRWIVTADGYYPSNLFEERFEDFDEVVVPPAVSKVILHEHEKHGSVTLYRKRNPQPMYAYSREKVVKSPIANGRYGFDLQLFDWLPPLGNGKVADFYYVRDRKDTERVKRLISENNEHRIRVFRSDDHDAPKLGEVVGRVEFEPGGGAYVRKQTGNENFPATYCANLSADYHSSIPIKICVNNGKLWLQEGPVITKGDYMVIRSRIKHDDQGNVISANYSKIIGPWGIGSLMCPYETVFNPVPNDPNLEFDPARNLYQGKKGRGMIP